LKRIGAGDGMWKIPSEWDGKAILKARLVLGLLQGLVLFALIQAYDAKAWTDSYSYLLILFLTLFLPLVAIAGLGNVRLRALLAWIGFLAVVIAAVSLAAAYKAGPLLTMSEDVFPKVGAVLLVGLFVAHTLFIAAQNNGTFIAPYNTYFELAWKHAVQIAASAGFVAAFWLLYFLGTELFKLIKIDLLDRLIQDGRIVPITAVLVATALHVTDVRPNIVAGIRALALTLLSWLLPLMTGLIVLFLVAVPFAGFDLLWGTRMATALLLMAAAALIVLINAVYQNGPAEQTAPGILRSVALVAAMALVPLALVAAYGLGLRVAQYGWTGDRIIAAACVLVALGYAGGYAFAAARRGPWLAFLERTNIAMSYVVVLIAFVLHTPIADPDRLSVASQVARLQDGRTEAEQFDLKYLRFEAGRYGTQALEELREDAGLDSAMRERVVAALKSTTPSELENGVLTPVMLAANIETLTPDKTLPASFLEQNWQNNTLPFSLPPCLQTTQRCQALVVDMNRDGADEVILFTVYDTYVESGQVFHQAEGAWRRIGQLSAGKICLQTLEAIRTGGAVAVAPLWDELNVGAQRINLEPDAGACQSTPVN